MSCVVTKDKQVFCVEQSNTQVCVTEQNAEVCTTSSQQVFKAKNNDKTVCIDSNSGEANTASNAGTVGVGLVLPKIGVDLPFKSISSSSGAIIVKNDIFKKTVDLGVDESKLTSGKISSDLRILICIEEEILKALLNIEIAIDESSY